MVLAATVSDMPSKRRCGPKLAMKYLLWIKEGTGIAVDKEGSLKTHMGTSTFSYSNPFNSLR